VMSSNGTNQMSLPSPRRISIGLATIFLVRSSLRRTDETDDRDGKRCDLAALADVPWQEFD